MHTRTFEPDEPQLHPPDLRADGKTGSYTLSILKSAGGDPASCRRYFFDYESPLAGQGHFIHTYMGDGNPLPSFEGEPEQVSITRQTPQEFAQLLWNSLNEDNKVSLFVRYIDRRPAELGERHPQQALIGGMNMTELELKYGCNPNQKPARIFMETGELPIRVLNGKPGYINFLDAFNSWQLVKELKPATGLPAAASFKHVSPAGAAVGTPLTDVERQIYFAQDMELSPIACAYVKARGADRLCSYGDWAALSDVCDAQTARYLALEVSDGVIAPGYTDEALAILKTKRKGGYNVVEIDPRLRPQAPGAQGVLRSHL